MKQTTAIMLSATTLTLLFFLHLLPTPTTTTRANFTLPQLYTLQTRIFNTTISPPPNTNTTTASPLLAPTIRGRVDITRQFTGRELNSEYLFGLFHQLNTTRTFTLLGIPTAYDVVHFAANRDVAASALLLHFASDFWGPFSLDLHVWSRFNPAGQVDMYDAAFRHWDLFVEEGLARVARERFGGDQAAVVGFAAERLAGAICATHEEFCVGEDRQYAGVEECERFLREEVRFGRPHEMGRDTLLCRMVHYSMVPLRPAVHCPHIGRGGGDMCEDGLAYGERISQDFWQEPWMPEELR